MWVTEYVVEEVLRQGHDVTTLDGIERVGWMLNAWCYALGRKQQRPNATDAIRIGQLVEPYKNELGLRRCGVRVGPRLCPDFERVPSLLQQLFEQRDALEPLAFYKEFELIHPFLDGNGRTGKILLNWLMGKLLLPEFPPNDLFGEWIGNP